MKRILLATLLALLLASNAHAAVSILDALVTQNPAEDCDPCAANFTLSAGSNRKFVCVIATEDGATVYSISGVTYNAIAMTQAAPPVQPDNNNLLAVYYLDQASLPSPGTYSVSVNFSESVVDVSISCLTLAGIAAGAPRDTDTFESTSANTATLSLTGVVGSDFTLVACIQNDNSSPAGGSWSHGSGQTEILDAVVGGTTPSAIHAISYEAGEAAPSCTSNQPAERFGAIAAVWAQSARRPAPPIIFP